MPTAVIEVDVFVSEGYRFSLQDVNTIAEVARIPWPHDLIVSTNFGSVRNLDSFFKWVVSHGEKTGDRYCISSHHLEILDAQLESILDPSKSSLLRHEAAFDYGLAPNDGIFTNEYYRALGRIRKMIRERPESSQVYISLLGVEEPLAARTIEYADLTRVSKELNVARILLELKGYEVSEAFLAIENRINELIG